MDDEVIRGTTVIKDGAYLAAAAAEALGRAAGTRSRSRAGRRRSKKGTVRRGAPMAGGTLAIMFAVARSCSSDRRYAPPAFLGTSPCSCSRASSATWSCGT
jgi:hypothetical protein